MSKSIEPIYTTSCPRCLAPAAKALLHVTSAKVSFRGVTLGKCGFNVYNATRMGTDEEQVTCAACSESFPLGECLLPDDWEEQVPYQLTAAGNEALATFFTRGEKSS